MHDTELRLHFSSGPEVSVSFGGTDSGRLPFVNPVTDKDRADIRWYIETYGAHSLADADDQEARRIRSRLPEIGKMLFDSVFSNRAAQRVFDRFQDASDRSRVLTIDSQDASILALPWELLHDSAPAGTFLFRDRPHISIRRRISGGTGGRAPFHVTPKDRLHLLFVVSRPDDAGFIDPRSDPQAVLDALKKSAPGRVTWEFLRPATLNALVARLDDDTKPPIDILHFDGHGVFRQVSEEEAQKNPGLYGKSIASEIQRERQTRGAEANSRPVGIGFLLFEKDDGQQHLIPAQDLAENLFRSKVGLVVLSACQTAALDVDGDPMASVAGRLTSTGIPAILAMTHAVLVPTTRMLFSQFYASLARGRGIATALDDARTFLKNNPQKFEVQRGNKRQMLELDDWFLPALFHGGADSPLLTSEAQASPAQEPVTKQNLRPCHEAGFFGRRRELWDIECWFAGEATRRISITGFGGQGKTELVLEAGRWLLRTGRFQHAVFVDYSQFQGEDAVAVAVSTLSSVLDHSLIDADAATQALKNEQAPTLVILDNLETLAPDPLHRLLTAAVAWSSAGNSRVLLTSRRAEFGHADYSSAGTRKHRQIALEGLGSAANPDDALDWFAKLRKLPPEPTVPPPQREDLIRLFDRVQFHPLSICVLAQQLKLRTARQLGERLEQILNAAAKSEIAVPGTPRSLVASLQLSLDRLSETERHAVRRLGVFQGGAVEVNLLDITGMGENDEQSQPGAELASPPAPAANLWPGLRRQLESAALIKAEHIPDVGPPFLRFHPTLAPMLWAGLEASEREALTTAHRRRYYALATWLYNEDRKQPHQARAIARCELPNLLYAVDRALDGGDVGAVAFVNCVNWFLGYFGLTREGARITSRAVQTGSQLGPYPWYLAQSNKGERLLDAGRAREASEIFAYIVETLGDQPSYELASTLGRLGRCYRAVGRPKNAEATYRKGIEVAEQLEPVDHVFRHRCALHTDLADVLTDQGKYAEARGEYELVLQSAISLNDLRSEGVILGQLGTLALQEGNLADAVNLYRDALKLFERLGEPATVATVHHQLGQAFQKTRQWERAEQHYRESARLEEQLGNIARAAQSWGQLATLNALATKPEAAECWYRKAIEGARNTSDTPGVSKMLSNLAAVLHTQPGRLDEARALAEEALAIKQTLDPGAAEIWTTYKILAKIATQQSQPDQATEYHRLAREAKRNFAGTAHEMKRFARMIFTVVATVGGNEKARDTVEPLLDDWTRLGGENAQAAEAARRILAGERDEHRLCENTNLTASMIISTILRAIADPSTLSELLPADAPDNA